MMPTLKTIIESTTEYDIDFIKHARQHFNTIRRDHTVKTPVKNVRLGDVILRKTENEKHLYMVVGIKRFSSSVVLSVLFLNKSRDIYKTRAFHFTNDSVVTIISDEYVDRL